MRKETNMEHYRDEIEKILNEADKACLAVVDGAPIRCLDVENCDECVFNNCNEKGREKTKIEWLMADYKEPIKLTAREKHFVEFAETGWIARDEDGMLCYFSEKPTISGKMWRSKDIYDGDVSAYGVCFEFIKWEDEEPWAVEDLRKLKVQE